MVKCPNPMRLELGGSVSVQFCQIFVLLVEKIKKMV